MNESKNAITRHAFLGSVIVLPALAAGSSITALADSKASKDSVHYQSTANEGRQCSGCKHFIPGQDANADGTCQLVDGSISPHGYCTLYTAKS